MLNIMYIVDKLIPQEDTATPIIYHCATCRCQTTKQGEVQYEKGKHYTYTYYQGISCAICHNEVRWGPCPQHENTYSIANPLTAFNNPDMKLRIKHMLDKDQIAEFMNTNQAAETTEE